MEISDTRQGACRISRTAARRLTCRRMTLSKSPTPPRTLTVADAHALADRLERSQRLQSDQETAVKLIRALLAGRAAGDMIVVQDE
jgi:hypothetical protein